jgi:hypothetical protein
MSFALAMLRSNAGTSSAIGNGFPSGVSLSGPSA